MKKVNRKNSMRFRNLKLYEMHMDSKKQTNKKKKRNIMKIKLKLKKEE